MVLFLNFGTAITPLEKSIIHGHPVFYNKMTRPADEERAVEVIYLHFSEGFKTTFQNIFVGIVCLNGWTTREFKKPFTVLQLGQNFAF